MKELIGIGAVKKQFYDNFTSATRMLPRCFWPPSFVSDSMGMGVFKNHSLRSMQPGCSVNRRRRIHKLAGKAGKKEPTRNTISAKVNFA